MSFGMLASNSGARELMLFTKPVPKLTPEFYACTEFIIVEQSSIEHYVWVGGGGSLSHSLFSP